jgi:hypothetical protein
MHRKAYEPSTSRTAIGFIAVAASAITMGALVVLPAELAATRGEPVELAEAKVAAGALLKFASVGRTRVGELAVFNGTRRSNAQARDPDCEEAGTASD